MPNKQPDPDFCDESGCLRKVLPPYIYCDEHQDNASTPPEASEGKPCPDPKCAYCHLDDRATHAGPHHYIGATPSALPTERHHTERCWMGEKAQPCDCWCHAVPPAATQANPSDSLRHEKLEAQPQESAIHDNLGNVISPEVYEAYRKGMKAVSQLLAAEHTRAQQAEQRGVAWAVSVIDDLHINGHASATFDSTYKGIKNTLRDRYKALTGIDPAPSYPVKVDLQQLTKEPK